jgi:hypothetical protein
MVPDGEPSKPEPRSHIAASTRGQHFATSASSQQLRIAGGEKSVSVPVTNDTKELESYLVEAATAHVSQNRNNNASVQAAYSVQINDQCRAKGSEKVPGGHAMDWGGQGRSSPRLGTRISTLLSPVPPTPSNDNKYDESATLTGKDSAQTRTLAYVVVSDNRDSGVPSASLGRLASAREQLR